MKRITKILIAMVLAAALIVTLASCNSKNTTSSDSYCLDERQVIKEKNLPEELAVYVDCSASIERHEAKKLKAKAEEIAGTDGVIFEFSDGEGGGNTEISFPLKMAAIRGHRQVAILTDGENWPVSIQEELEGLDLSFMSIRIICLEKDDNTEALVAGLKAANASLFSPFQKSTVKVEYLDGSPAEVVRSDYKPAVYEDADTLYELKLLLPEDSAEKGGVHWSWWWLLPLLLLLLLGLLLWWLLRKRHKDTSDRTETEPENTASPDGGAATGEQPVPTGISSGTGTPVATPVTPVETAAYYGGRCCCCCNCRKCRWPATISIVSLIGFLAFLGTILVTYLR